jgi:hypothetical protein
MTNYSLSFGDMYSSKCNRIKINYETLEQAKKEFQNVLKNKQYNWAQIICLKTNIIIELQKEHDINKKFYCDEYEFN